VSEVRPHTEVRRALSGLAPGLALAFRPAGSAEVSGAQGRVPLSAGGADPDNARCSGPVTDIFTAMVRLARRSANRSLCSTSPIACRSAGASARGWIRSVCGTRAGRGGGGLVRCRRYQLACGTARGRAGRPGADLRRHHGDRLIGH
jgi:hypothetical protein